MAINHFILAVQPVYYALGLGVLLLLGAAFYLGHLYRWQRFGQSETSEVQRLQQGLMTLKKASAEDRKNFQNVFYNAVDAVLIISGETFIDCNDATVVMLNAKSKDEVLSTHPSQLSPEFQPDGRPSFDKANEMIAKAFAEGFHRFEWMHTKVTGENFPVEVSLTTISLKGEDVLHVLWKDLSEQKALENSLRSSKDAAEAANIAKSDFLANMSHEIRTPMNGVMGMSEILLGLDLSPEQQDCVETIRTSGENLMVIINDILDFSKLEAGKMIMENISFDLRASIEQVADGLGAQADKKNIEILIQFAPQIPKFVFGDPGRFKQILTNLVGNAIKFTPKGYVLVSVKQVPLHGQAAFQCSVMDTGIGIPLDKLEMVFGEFTQADTSTTRKYGGTGIGLAISKKLVTLMGGEIFAQNREGGGAKFQFTLPLAMDPQGEQEASFPSALHGARVLVVDDLELSHSILGGYLNHWGLKPDFCATGERALQKLGEAATQGQAYQAVLIDQHMPGMDGLEVAKAIKATPSLKETPLLLLTSLGCLGQIKTLLAHGFSEYLVKPVYPNPLRTSLLRMLSANLQDAKDQPKQKSESLPLVGVRDDGRLLEVLVAEDNLINQTVARHLLERFGCNVQVVANGVACLELMACHEFDLIFMDIQMPEMNGYETTQAIRQQENPIPIVALTAHALKTDKQKCLDAGMNDYITKPASPNDFKAALEKWAAKEVG